MKECFTKLKNRIDFELTRTDSGSYPSDLVSIRVWYIKEKSINEKKRIQQLESEVQT